MSDEPQKQPELICLNQSFDGLKAALVETVFKELVKRIVEKMPFKLEVVYQPDMDCAMYGDWAYVKFTPPKATPAVQETKP